MDDPVVSWMFPDRSKRERYGGGYFLIHARRSMRAATSWHTDGGAALWDPPDAWRFTPREMLELAVRSAPGSGLSGATRGRALEAVEDKHPTEPHFYLAVLGVRPERQGRGVGAALLAPGLARADAAHLPCYLESSNPRNVSLYERHGFETTGEHRLPDGPAMTLMWRPAR